MNNLTDLLNQHKHSALLPDEQKETDPIVEEKTNPLEAHQILENQVASHDTTGEQITEAKKLLESENQPIRDVEEEDNNQELEKNNENSSSLDTAQIKKSLYSIKDQIDALLDQIDGKSNAKLKVKIEDRNLDTGEQIVEGIFNGEKMIDSEQKEYAVPPNYASKSKLVDGDLMKLTIKPNGSFIYKQIKPIERKRLIGKVEFDEESQKWTIAYNGKKYKVLTASVTFYRGKPGDEAVILVAEDGSSSWGAVENIISK